MSYDIYFFKSQDLSIEKVEQILESEIDSSSPLHISKKQMDELEALLKAKGLVFETADHGAEVELDFPTYQIFLSSGQVTITVPYWDINKNEGVDGEIKKIVNVLLENGFSGYDPQTEKIIKEKFSIDGETFQTGIDTVEKVQTNVGMGGLMYYGIGLMVMLMAITVIWRLRK